MRFWIDELARRLAELGVGGGPALAVRSIRAIQGGPVVALAIQDGGQFEAAMSDLRQAIDQHRR